MSIKNLIISAIVGGVLFLFLDWLVYGNLLLSYFNSHTGAKGSLDRSEIEILPVIIGCFFQGLTIAYFFSLANISSIVSGFAKGGIIGFLIICGVDFLLYGTTFVLSKHSLMADIIAATAISAIVGAVIGLLLDKLKKFA
jgi:hypothetical protein